MSEAKIRVLFVCMGNICRSPAGENVLRHLVESEGLEERIEIDSAGTIGLHTGNPPDERMVEAARKRGLPMEGSARQVRPSDFADFDWILAMDDANYEDLLVIQSKAEFPKGKLVKFCEFCEEHDEAEVPDPYYGGDAGFENVLDILEDGCAGFLNHLKSGKLSLSS